MNGRDKEGDRLWNSLHRCGDQSIGRYTAHSCHAYSTLPYPTLPYSHLLSLPAFLLSTESSGSFTAEEVTSLFFWRRSGADWDGDGPGVGVLLRGVVLLSPLYTGTCTAAPGDLTSERETGVQTGAQVQMSGACRVAWCGAV